MTNTLGRILHNYLFNFIMERCKPVYVTDEVLADSKVSRDLQTYNLYNNILIDAYLCTQLHSGIVYQY